MEKTFQINEIINKLLLRANTLGTIIIQGNSDFADFEKIAFSIMDDPAIVDVIIAPGGVISGIYPDIDREIFFEQDFFDTDLIKNSRNSVLYGPFTIKQNTLVLAGISSLYSDVAKSNFWGFVAVIIKFPGVLDNTELAVSSIKDIAYELWKTNTETGERQIILSNTDSDIITNGYIEKQISITGGDWYLRVWPIQFWYNNPENIGLIVAGFFVSIFVLFLMQNNFELKRVRVVLESMAKTDSLTGIFNRRHFVEISQIIIEKLRRQNKNGCYVVIFDLDFFKRINDVYGHIIGDHVLVDVSKRIKAAIRPYDIFARYGGEEFVILASEITNENMIEMAERLRTSLCSKIFDYNEVSLEVSASFGVALLDDYNLEKTIIHADKSLYAAKREGRNKVVFFNEDSEKQV